MTEVTVFCKHGRSRAASLSGPSGFPEGPESKAEKHQNQVGREHQKPDHRPALPNFATQASVKLRKSGATVLAENGLAREINCQWQQDHAREHQGEGKCQFVQSSLFYRISIY